MRVNDLLVLFLLSQVLASCSPPSDGSGGTAPTVSYYVDSSGGNDSNNGLSASSPWATLAKVGNTSLSTNSVVYLKRGSTWYEELDLNSSNIGLDAYGAGADPIIDGSTGLASGAWTAESSNIYSQAITLGTSEALGNVSANGTLMNFVPWNSNFTTTFSGAQNGSYSYTTSPAKVYIFTSSGTTSTVYRASIKPYGIKALGLTNVSIKNITIQRFSLNGVHFKNCTGCQVLNSTVKDGGGAFVSTNPSAPPDYIYGGNGIQYETGSTNGYVYNTTISNIFNSGVSPQTYHSNETVTGVSVTACTITNCGLAGVEISVLNTNGATGSSLSNILVSDSVITNSGYGFSGQRYGTEGRGIRIQADIGAGTMANIQVMRTSISGSKADGLYLSGNVGATNLSRLKLKSNLYGVRVNDTGTSLYLNLTSSLIFSNLSAGIRFNSTSNKGFNISQNTLTNNGTYSLLVNSQATQAKLQNNIFSGTTASHLVVLGTLQGPVVRNNCYQSASNMISYNSTSYNNVLSFKTTTGLDTGAIDGTSVNHISVSTEQFALLSTSQCKGMGSALAGVILDYNGRTYGSPPSAGAIEY